MAPVALEPLRLQERFSFAHARPREQDVLTVLGYPEGKAPAAVVAAARERLLAEPETLWAIEAGAVVFPAAGVDPGGRVLVVDDVRLQVGQTVAAQLARTEALAVFVCTAGAGVERLARRLVAEGDGVGAFIADTIGSLVVEKSADLLEERLQAYAGGRGRRLTNRFSPGYCGWPVEEQQQLFRLLPPGFCGVRLSESSLMQPLKSVSGVIGIGSEVHRQEYTCTLCDLESCLYRRLQPARAAEP